LQRFCNLTKMENLTTEQEVNETTKKEWVKPEMVEMEVKLSVGSKGDGEGAS
jgi:hypothetical protein